MKLTDKIEVVNRDCLWEMFEYPSGYFDLAVIDPPYGIGLNEMNLGKATVKARDLDWDATRPDKQFFETLFHVSKNQIIWGGNHFCDNLPISRGWIFWDKDTNGDYSDGELAWSSFDKSLKKVSLVWDGFRTCEKTVRIHPTQKPIKLYDWIYKNYTTGGMRVLDTHMGSGSSAISADKFDLEYVGCELNPDYFNGAVDRFQKYKSQYKLAI